ncbi:lens fiber membrane intrinsic protein-like [Clytia hemisphaerica]|uniref:Cnidarian restricted protein n=1 Tax=Clytia hemisphaerica TaxID=252671 RepID=A0A7M5V1N9_9CNID|eukprot:TCONS_00022832-protein
MKLSRVLIMLSCVVASTLLIAATAGVAWGRNENNGALIGLWKFCDRAICHKFKEMTVEGWWYAIRVNMVLSLLSAFSGFILSFAMVLNNSLSTIWLALIYFISGVLSASSLIVWGIKITPPYRLSYSYVLGLIAFVLELLVIVCCFLEEVQKRRNRRSSSSDGSNSDLQNLQI